MCLAFGLETGIYTLRQPSLILFMPRNFSTFYTLIEFQTWYSLVGKTACETILCATMKILSLEVCLCNEIRNSSRKCWKLYTMKDFVAQGIFAQRTKPFVAQSPSSKHKWEVFWCQIIAQQRISQCKDFCHAKGIWNGWCTLKSSYLLCTYEGFILQGFGTKVCDQMFVVCINSTSGEARNWQRERRKLNE